MTLNDEHYLNFEYTIMEHINNEHEEDEDEAMSALSLVSDAYKQLQEMVAERQYNYANNMPLFGIFENDFIEAKETVDHLHLAVEGEQTKRLKTQEEYIKLKALIANLNEEYEISKAKVELKKLELEKKIQEEREMRILLQKYECSDDDDVLVPVPKHQSATIVEVIENKPKRVVTDEPTFLRIQTVRKVVAIFARMKSIFWQVCQQLYFAARDNLNASVEESDDDLYGKFALTSIKNFLAVSKESQKSVTATCKNAPFKPFPPYMDQAIIAMLEKILDGDWDQVLLAASGNALINFELKQLEDFEINVMFLKHLYNGPKDYSYADIAAHLQNIRRIDQVYEGMQFVIADSGNILTAQVICFEEIDGMPDDVSFYLEIQNMNTPLDRYNADLKMLFQRELRNAETDDDNDGDDDDFTEDTDDIEVTVLQSLPALTYAPN